jgi:hypothetical protein
MACPNMRGGCRTDLGALVWCRALASFAMRTRPPITITANFAVMMTSPWRAGRMPAPAHSCTMTIRNYPQSRYSGCLRQRGVPVKSPVIPNDARPILDPTVLKSPPRRPRQHFYAGRSRPLIRAPPPHNRGIHLDRRRRGQTLGAKLALCCNVGDALGDQSRRKG